MAVDNRKSLMYWVRGGPTSRAHSVRVTTSEGVKTVSIDANASRPWAQTVDTILSMGATRVEALDASGNVMRATELEAPEDAPDGPESVAPGSALQSDLQFLGSLLADAYRRGAENGAQANVQAFDKLVALTETAFKRLEGFEKAWGRMFATQERMLRDGQGGSDEDQGGDVTKQVQAMLGSLIASQVGRMGAAPATASAPVANGAAEPAKGGDES